MLQELSVQNLAIIEDVRVELRPGFCAWTGETGAGKSLFLGALGLLLGERGSTDLLRAGAEELRVTGRFELDSPQTRREVESILGGPLDDDEIILARRLNRGGRSQAYANDRPVVLSTLKQIGNLLVDIHGQRETESLLHPAYAGVSLGLLHGSQPDVFVVCHQPGRERVLGYPDYPLPSITETIELTVLLGRRTNPAIRCAGVSLNTSHLNPIEARDLLARESGQLRLPVADPMRPGREFERLVDTCLA